MTKEAIDSVSECSRNIINNVGLTKAQKQLLRSKKTHIRKLAKTQTLIAEKKKTINKKGGALVEFLLKPLIGPIIGSVLGGLANVRA